MARQYRESFDVTGSKASFEWQQVEGEDPVIHTKNSARRSRSPRLQIPARVKVPDYAASSCPSRSASSRCPRPSRTPTHLSFLQGGGHGGSHPHLTHNFLMAVLGKQPAFPDAPTSANWTLVGICAHESAMAGGTRVEIPRY